MEAEGFPRAEEALRLLAAAAGAARLYPPTSPLPREAAERFLARSNVLTASGPLRYSVHPHEIQVGDVAVATGQGQVVSLAESLHAIQVGQIVIAPGVSLPEVEAFIQLANADPVTVRGAGGARSILSRAGVSHIAVIEVSLRTSEESGLLGIDPLTAPLDELASEIAAAAERRGRAATQGAASDEMAEAIGRLEEATRGIALERVASALMRLDEKTRIRVLAIALKADANGARMDGMLEVIGHMKPAALARLLTLVATHAQTDPRRVAAAIPLPPETASALAMLLAPSPDISPDFGTPDSVRAAEMAHALALDEDDAETTRQVALASPSLSASRALATATAVSRVRMDSETIRAIADVLPQAARDGSFTVVREALRRLHEIDTDPYLSDAVVVARASLADAEVLRDVCLAAQTDADAAIAGEILQAAGTAGAEALLDCYVRFDGPHQSLFRPVLRGASDTVLGVARSRLRSADPRIAMAIVETLGMLGDRRAVALLAEALDASLDEQVRFTAATTLANQARPEATQALVRALGHREVETQRHVARELGRIKADSAVPALVRTFDDVKVLAKSYEMRKDIIAALAAIGSPDAAKALQRFSARPGLGRRSRELKRLARDAHRRLATNQGADAL